MRRGDLVTIVLPGAYGKPRPALIIQSDDYRNLDSVTFLPLTSEIYPARFRLTVEATVANGLHSQSQIMVDKCSTLPLAKVGATFGRLSDDDMAAVNRALAVFLGFT